MKDSNYLITCLVDIRASRNQRTAAQGKKEGRGRGGGRSKEEPRSPTSFEVCERAFGFLWRDGLC